MAAKKKKTPLIIDTDMSPDSWAAVLFAARHPGTDLLAVSVSGTGEAHGPTGARNAQRLLALAERPDVPVAYGAEKPLRGREHFPGLMRFVIDQMFFNKPPRVKGAPQPGDSVQLLRGLLERSKEPVTIAAVGPQTNLAAVLARFPGLKPKIKGIFIMGGAVDVPGNIKEIAFWKANTTAEWNFFCDPLAAKTVLESGVPVSLVPLDATNQVPVTADFLARLRAADLSPAGEYAYRMLELMVIKLRAGTGFYLWDPITTACALDPSLADWSERRLDVVREKGREWGRVTGAPECAPVTVAGKLDGERFEEKVIEVFSNKK